MFFTFVLFLAALLYMGIRLKGPVLGLSISWLVSCSPIILDLLIYSHFDRDSAGYILLLITYLLSFMLGVGLACIRFRTESNVSVFSGVGDSKLLFSSATYPIAVRVWYVALIAIAAQLVDFALLGGASLDDLSQLRDIFQSKVSTPMTLIANITTWACLYCFAFAIFMRSELSRSQYIKFISPTIGYFLVAILSAGRQAAFQLMLFAIVLMLMPSQKKSSNQKVVKKNRPKLLRVVVFSALMISYMGYVAIKRNDGDISNDKIVVLSQIFNFTLAPSVDYFAQNISPEIGATFVEAMVYFSSSVMLFSEFVTLEERAEYFGYGAFTFPFAMRQLEPVTGISVIGALQNKIKLMYSLGAMGNGWTTGFSSYMLDFGYVGAGLFIIIIGYYSQRTWIRAKKTGDFHDVVISSLLIISAIYTPFLLASAETNLFLLWLFCLFAGYYIRRKKKDIQVRLNRKITEKKYAV